MFISRDDIVGISIDGTFEIDIVRKDDVGIQNNSFQLIPLDSWTIVSISSTVIEEKPFSLARDSAKS